MALSGIINLPKGSDVQLRIEFQNNGRELYWLNDVLIQDISACGKGLSHIRKIPVTGYDIELRYSLSGQEPFADIYIDDLLYKEDIFLFRKFLKKDSSKLSFGIKIFILLLILIGFFFDW